MGFKMQQAGEVLTTLRPALTNQAVGSVGMAAYNYKDLTGVVKDHLTCLGDSGNRTRDGSVLWRWQCSCGNVVERTKTYLNRVSTCGHGCPYSRELHAIANRGREPELKHPVGHSGAMRLYDIYRRRCRKRGLGFDLTFDQFRELTSQCCHYCGAPPAMLYVHQYDRSERARRHAEYVFNSLDRIDNSLGYVLSNSRPSCHLCNMMKRTMGEDEFKQQIARIYHHYVRAEAEMFLRKD
jgi:hypothetical protein